MLLHVGQCPIQEFCFNFGLQNACFRASSVPVYVPNCFCAVMIMLTVLFSKRNNNLSDKR